VRHAAFLAAGLLATSAQVLLLRELVVDVAGDEAAIGVGLAAWLGGIAAGASAARRRCAAKARGDASAGLALLVMLSLLGLLGGRAAARARAAGGELPDLGLVVVLSLATLAPPGAAVGWTFTALASSASRRWEAGEGIARLYVLESLGSLLGGVAVTVLAGSWMSPLRVGALLGVTSALLASSPGAAESYRPRVLAAAFSWPSPLSRRPSTPAPSERASRERPPACRCGASSTRPTSTLRSAATTCSTSTRAGST
jgi:hypothetical protein